jgi:hypothetical protein
VPQGLGRVLVTQQGTGRLVGFRVWVVGAAVDVLDSSGRCALCSKSPHIMSLSNRQLTSYLYYHSVIICHTYVTIMLLSVSQVVKWMHAALQKRP